MLLIRNSLLQQIQECLEYKAKMESISKRLYASLEKNDLADVKKLIEELEIVCPVSGTRNWTEVTAVQPDVFNTNGFNS